MKKTKDGFDITVGMTVWVNPECVFEDVIELSIFTDKHIVKEIRNHVVWAHPENCVFSDCDFFFCEIFAKKENWKKDRSEKIEEVILSKRETMTTKIAKMEQELARIERIRDEWEQL